MTRSWTHRLWVALGALEAPALAGAGVFGLAFLAAGGTPPGLVGVADRTGAALHYAALAALGAARGASALGIARRRPWARPFTVAYLAVCLAEAASRFLGGPCIPALDQIGPAGPALALAEVGYRQLGPPLTAVWLGVFVRSRVDIPERVPV